MRVEFLTKFHKDLQKIKQQSVLDAVEESIINAESANSINEVKNLKKLAGYKNVYRVRVGDYRIGLFIENDIIEFARIAHRKDIYNVFP